MKRSAFKSTATPMRRSAPLQQGGKGLKPGGSSLKRSAFKPGSKGLANSTFKPPSVSAKKVEGGPRQVAASLSRGSGLSGKPKHAVQPVQSILVGELDLSMETVSHVRDAKPIRYTTLKAGAKRMKAKRRAVPKAEKEHMGRVAGLGCILCQHMGYGATPAIVHHLRTGQGKMRATNWLTMPLCPDHHQFSGFGVHDMGRRQFYDKYGISEIGLLLLVFEQLRVDRNDPRFVVPPDAITAAEHDEPDCEEVIESI